MFPGVGPEGQLRCLPTPLVVLSTGVMPSTLLLPLTPCFCSPLFRSGSWVFLDFLYLLYLVVQNLPQLQHARSFFSPLQFPCILLLKETFVQVQAL